MACEPPADTDVINYATLFILLFTLHCQLNVPVCRANHKIPYNGFYLIPSIIYFILETVLLQNVSTIYDVTF